MDTSTATQTVNVMVLAPGRAAEEREYAVGTPVAKIAEDIGIASADGVQAYDEMSRKLDGDSEITPATEVVNFVVRLAGAQL